MVDTLYIEEKLFEHPRVKDIQKRFHRAEVIGCDRYTEVFNLRAQNFRLQKQNPALIIAEKHGNAVLPTPPEYQIGADRNYYFSHMLNCLYDCRYCFLQGMYQSAHYVWFVNYDIFEQGIDDTLALPENQGKRLCFFSGYDCDSLALESVTSFAEHFLPFFAKRPQAWLELRTKSIQTAVLTNQEPIDNVIVSYTLTPDSIAREIEHGAPGAQKRIERIQSLTQQGWQVGLRFDPLIPWPNYQSIYSEFFEQVFASVPEDKIHSVTIGPMRFPSSMYDRIVKLYPDDALFARFALEKQSGQATFPEEVERKLVLDVESLLYEHLPTGKVFNQTAH